MANHLKSEKKQAAVAALCEGSSIQAIERMTGIHRDTIMRLGARVGNACTEFMRSAFRDLPCTDIQLDEIWGFVAKKQKNVKEGEKSAFGCRLLRLRRLWRERERQPGIEGFRRVVDW